MRGLPQGGRGFSPAILLSALLLTACVGILDLDGKKNPLPLRDGEADLVDAPDAPGEVDAAHDLPVDDFLPDDAEDLPDEVVPAGTVWVSSTTGDDASPGTLEQPVKTIAQAVSIAAADPTRPLINLIEGTYGEAVVLSGSMQLTGGFRADGSFECDPSLVTLSSTTGRGIDATTTTGAAVRCLTIDVEGTTASGNVYGIFAYFPDDLLVESVWIIAGAGAEGDIGAAGLTGPAGIVGGTGTNGGDGACTGAPGGMGGAAPCGFPGAHGGTGGNPGLDGISGDDAIGGEGTGGLGGDGGSGSTTTTSAVSGNGAYHGTYGRAGEAGAPGAGTGSFSAEGYEPAEGGTGGVGTPGTGGGGGGGGGGISNANGQACGGGGGGGGGGGCAGSGGGGGKGGGGSFCIYVHSGSLTVTGSMLLAGDGGKGGRGGASGNGGLGGAGGPGGSYTSIDGTDPAQRSGSGGAGGNGGQGGRGGSGGGGGGGPSIGILAAGGCHLVYTDNTFQLGLPGEGGYGAEMNSGFAGLAIDVHQP